MPRSLPPGFADTHTIHYRGRWSDSVFENTLLALALPDELGEREHGIEFDVRVTQDRRLIVSHDSNIRRQTGGQHKDPISSLTLDEIQFLNRSLPAERQIAILDEIWEPAAQRPKVIEIKTGPNWLPTGNGRPDLKSSWASALALEYQLACDQNLRDKVVIQSFDIFTLLKLKNDMPGFTYSWLVGVDPQALPKGIRQAAKAMERYFLKHADRYPDIGFSCYKAPVSRRGQQILQDQRTGLVWTCETKEEAHQARRRGQIPICNPGAV